MERIIITGATGVIGTALQKELIKRNHEIYVVCRPDSKRLNQVIQNALVHKIECDLKDLSRLPQLINKECDGFFHLGWVGTLNPRNRFDMYLQNKNVKYALDAVEAAHALSCKVFIGAGSQAEYGNKGGILKPESQTTPVSGYGMAKLCAGQMTRYMCQQYGIRHIWPRIVSVYGENDGPQTLINWTIKHLLDGKRPPLTLGNQMWDYLYSADAAVALCEMYLHGRNKAVYVLGNGNIKPLREYIEIIRDEINPLASLGFGEIPYNSDQVMHLEADISSLRKDTGWYPKTSFRVGIKSLIKTFKQ